MNQIMFDKASLDEAALEAISGLSAGSKAMLTVEVTIGEVSDEKVDASVDTIIDVSVAPEGEESPSPLDEDIDVDEGEEVPAAIAVLAPEE